MTYDQVGEVLSVIAAALVLGGFLCMLYAMEGRP